MNRKLAIVIFFVLLLLLLAARGIPWLINWYLNNNANRIVTNMITRTNTFYGHEISFGKIVLDYNYSGTYLTIDSIHIGQSEELEGGRTVVLADIQKLQVSGFKWRAFLLENSIHVDTALLHGVSIRSFTPPLDSLIAATQTQQAEKKPKRDGPKDYELIQVDFFDLQDLSIRAYNNEVDSIRLALVDLDLNIRQFQLTKEDIKNPKSLFSVEDIHGTIEGIELHFDDYRQYLVANAIELDTREQFFTIGYAGLLHKLGKYEYTGLFGERKAWIQLDSLALDLEGFNFNKFFKESIIEVDTVKATGLILEAFLDKRKTENLQKRPQLIHAVLSELAQPFHIEHVQIANGKIIIEERPDNAAPRSGSLFFSELNGTIQNMSNIPEKRGDNDWLTVDASAKLMGQGSLQALIRYDLVHPEGRFTLRGTLRDQPLASLNNIIEPEAKASIKSGFVQRLDFNIAGNEYEGTGDLIVRFDDLALELLNQDFKSDNNLWRKIGSFLANKLVVRGSNPSKSGSLREGEVYFLRQPHKSIFNYWWQLIFSGLRSTITGEDQEKLKGKQLENRNVGGDQGIQSGEKESKTKRKEKRIFKSKN
ncbi:DUF748 domain-containing protein [Mongoliitalea daihaiensis]|uniref:DUF748 domain-containing protein n=1 Tax=Mongoliitalea daihaiensis TaxID=2782006 RepID=UPI001F316051|nr:DUF748 domain-containing protein [Mongoliitalea daihaiensis]UJP65836.1 DUF748 domain-containing protein [Mongoliitalea daihaiensis]